MTYKEKPCQTCGTVFSPASSSNVHCSDACLKESHWAKYLGRNYGITPAQYYEMEDKQDGNCRICNTIGFSFKPGHRPLMVDHCHETGVIRGLICANCNRALGLFKDNPTLLMTAAMYVSGDHENIQPVFTKWKQRCYQSYKNSTTL